MSTKALFSMIIIGAVITAAVFLYVGNNLKEVNGAIETLTPLPTPTPNFSRQFIMYDVPFTPQAPFAEWEDQRQQDGCEEASILMAMRWVQDRDLSLSEARTIILDMADFLLVKYGEYRDTSAEDMITRIFNDYFEYYNVRLKTRVSIDDIKEELRRGNIILAPTNGRLLGNPYFSGEGPEYHALIIKGYDERTGEFITNDPGTKRGESYRYKYEVMENAIADYPTGFHRPRLQDNKTVIVIEK